MTPVNDPAVEPEPEEMGEVSRLIGVFFEPAKAFADIVERPRWLVPMVLAILASLAYTISLGQRIGWERIIDQQIQSRAAQMSEQQRAAVERSKPLQVKIASVASYAGVFLGIPAYYLAASGVLFLIVNGLMGAAARFKQVFAVMCYAGLPGAIYAALAAVSVNLQSDPADFDIKNPLPFNPGWWMSPDGASKFLRSLAASVDLFSIWSLLLIAAGLNAAGGKRLTFGGALAAVVLPWAVLCLARATLIAR